MSLFSQKALLVMKQPNSFLLLYRYLFAQLIVDHDIYLASTYRRMFLQHRMETGGKIPIDAVLIRAFYNAYFLFKSCDAFKLGDVIKGRNLFEPKCQSNASSYNNLLLAYDGRVTFLSYQIRRMKRVPSTSRGIEILLWGEMVLVGEAHSKD